MQKNLNKEVASDVFFQLFEQYRGMVYAIALRMLGQGEDAKDAVQETFIRAFTHLHTLNDHAALGGWLKSIVYNHCLMELRYRKKRMIALGKYAKQKEIFEDAIQHSEGAPEQVKTTLAGLSETLQLTSLLRYFSKNPSYQEIASILSIPVGTVRSRLAESRKILASLIAQQDHTQRTNKAREMEDFFNSHFPHVYDSPVSRNAMINQFDRWVSISFTGGKKAIGSELVRKQIEWDMKHGARATLAEVHSSGAVSILELSNINPRENPTLCPLSSTFIFVHPQHKTEKAYLHHANTPMIVG